MTGNRRRESVARDRNEAAVERREAGVPFARDAPRLASADAVMRLAALHPLALMRGCVPSLGRARAARTRAAVTNLKHGDERR